MLPNVEVMQFKRNPLIIMFKQEVKALVVLDTVRVYMRCHYTHHHRRRCPPLDT